MNIIRKISTNNTYPIRLEVLRKNIDLPYKFDGDLDADTFHLGAFENEDLVGVATFMKRSNKNFSFTKQYQLRGMATLAEVRGKGFGNALIAKATRMLKDKKIEILWCNAREIAVEFYQKNGFVTIENSFDVPLIGKHYVMQKKNLKLMLEIL